MSSAPPRVAQCAAPALQAASAAINFCLFISGAALWIGYGRSPLALLLFVVSVLAIASAALALEKPVCRSKRLYLRATASATRLRAAVAVGAAVLFVQCVAAIILLAHSGTLTGDDRNSGNSSSSSGNSHAHDSTLDRDAQI